MAAWILTIFFWVVGNIISILIVPFDFYVCVHKFKEGIDIACAYYLFHVLALLSIIFLTTGYY